MFIIKHLLFDYEQANNTQNTLLQHITSMANLLCSLILKERISVKNIFGNSNSFQEYQ